MEQGTEEWLKARLGKATASMISDILAGGKGLVKANYETQLIAERLTGEVPEHFTSPAMEWGTLKEPEARLAYELRTGNRVMTAGFVDHHNISMAGASPDGLIDADGLIEIKCPNTKTHLKLLDDGKINRKYLYQMLWQMACTKRTWCDFVSYDPRLPSNLRLKIIRVVPNGTEIEDLEENVLKFLEGVDRKIASLKERYGELT